MCSGAAPGVIVYKNALKNSQPQYKRAVYQACVLIITYLTYTAYHAAKRPMSVVKGELDPNCTVTLNSTNCHPWKPFDKNSTEYFSLLDCAFLMSYALAMFVSGYVAEHTNLRIYLSVGMMLTGLFTIMYGMAYYWNIHSISYFFLINIITGITQSTGWPCVVESVGSWFPEGRRGFIMGVWNTHTSVGNIVGTAIAAAFVKKSWGLSFIVPGTMIGAMGIIVLIFLIPDPRYVGMEDIIGAKKGTRNIHTQKREQRSTLVSPDPIRRLSDDDDDSEDENEPDAIGIWGALKIPGVIEYSLCLFFAKLVSYTFLYWLPFYISRIKIAGVQYDDSKAADFSIFFDAGGAFGGIIAGLLVDVTRLPGIVNVGMLIFAAPLLFLFKFEGTNSMAEFITYMVISGFFVNGPYALITTAVSASLGTHECLQGNTKAMAVVTSIIDATGSLGAAIGPLLAGIISESSWSNVFYMLITADLLAAVFLSRQFIQELLQVINGWQQKRTNKIYSSTEETEPLVHNAEST